MGYKRSTKGIQRECNQNQKEKQGKEWEDTGQATISHVFNPKDFSVIERQHTEQAPILHKRAENTRKTPPEQLEYKVRLTENKVGLTEITGSGQQKKSAEVFTSADLEN